MRDQLSGGLDQLGIDLTSSPLDAEAHLTALGAAAVRLTTAVGGSAGRPVDGCRPRSAARWVVDGSDQGHRWSDDRWDWALVIHSEAAITREALRALQRRLSPD